MNDHSPRNFSINFGPQHPAAHGVLRLVLELDGEIVERVDPHIGLLHRGTEKLMEARTYLQDIPYFDRLDYVLADEPGARLLPGHREAAGIEVPRRAQLIRVLYLRDRPHPVAPAQRHHAGAGRRRPDAAALGLRGAREADGLLRARVGRAAACQLLPARRRAIGPAAKQLIEDIGAWCDPFLKVLDDLHDLFIDNRIFKQRNVDIGIVTLEECWRWGFSGP